MTRSVSGVLSQIAILVVVTAGWMASAAGTAAAPRADPWPRWQAHDENAQATIDHGALQRFLAAYLVRSDDGINRLRYAAVGDAERTSLEDYVAGLARLPISAYARDQQLAYWINLYNALTITVVLEHYPVASIRDIGISPGLFSVGPWGAKLITVEGEELSLDDIEHRILRPIWRDPRIHYAVNCAALGCPNLQPEPFRAETLDAQLDRAARTFINHPRGVLIEDDRLIVSRIYGWFEEDFGGSEQGVLGHLKRFAGPELRRRLEAISTIDDYEYDWSLNDASRPSG
jgi:Protein of unknown function, DUF547